MGSSNPGAKGAFTPFFKIPNVLRGRLEAYHKKSNYKFGKTIGKGTHGIVREAEGPDKKKVAIKVILKKDVKGKKQMVIDKVRILREMKHPHIAQFFDWFESGDRYYIVTQMASGGELFDRICERGKFTERDASHTIRQILEAVDYLHKKDVVHRDLKPEAVLYLTDALDSDLVLTS